jgi:hypothetical protein
MTAHSAQPNPTAAAERPELVLERIFYAVPSGEYA